jgi:hypothetical protein
MLPQDLAVLVTLNLRKQLSINGKVAVLQMRARAETTDGGGSVLASERQCARDELKAKAHRGRGACTRMSTDFREFACHRVSQEALPASLAGLVASRAGIAG